MKSRPFEAIALLTIAAFSCSAAARADVFAELDATGRFAQTRIDLSGRGGRVWEPTGGAASAALRLNPNGDLRGDGAPEISVSPTTGLPRAVWTSRGHRSVEVVTSSFDGRAWSRPLPIHVPAASDAADPRIAFTPSGSAIVVWWEKGSSPVVRMAILPRSRNTWIDAGVLSASGERAKEPSLLQTGDLTIVAYRTPKGIQIITRTIVESTFGDGPMPFPHGDPNLPPG